MSTTPITETWPVPAEVAAVFDGCDHRVRAELLALRELVLTTAAETDGVGAITETLKWGQPAYLTNESRSGSTVRIAPTGKGSNHDVALFFICHTDLVDRFRALFGDTFAYDGDRALLFDVGQAMPEDELRQCIAMALTYHQAA